MSNYEENHSDPNLSRRARFAEKFRHLMYGYIDLSTRAAADAAADQQKQPYVPDAQQQAERSRELHNRVRLFPRNAHFDQQSSTVLAPTKQDVVDLVWLDHEGRTADEVIEAMHKHSADGSDGLQ